MSSEDQAIALNLILFLPENAHSQYGCTSVKELTLFSKFKGICIYDVGAGVVK